MSSNYFDRLYIPGLYGYHSHEQPVHLSAFIVILIQLFYDVEIYLNQILEINILQCIY